MPGVRIVEPRERFWDVARLFEVLQWWLSTVNVHRHQGLVVDPEVYPEEFQQSRAIRPKKMLLSPRDDTVLPPFASSLVLSRESLVLVPFAACVYFGPDVDLGCPETHFDLRSLGMHLGLATWGRIWVVADRRRILACGRISAVAALRRI